LKVRTRLVASFAYVLLVVIVALTIPLAIVLRDRARSELEALALSNAQTIAALLDGSRLSDRPGDRQRLTRDVERYARDVGGRVVVLDPNGTAIADSSGEDLGEDFVTPGRPEVARAFDSAPTAEVRRSDEEGGDIVVAAAPVIDEGRLIGVVRTSRGVQAVDQNVGRATAAIAAVALGGLVAGLLLAIALARSLARPLSRLAAAARRLGAGDLSARAGSLEGGTEIDEMAASFDEMAARMERTVRAQREFVANASHQLRTPLTGMKLRLEAAIAAADDPALADELRAADREVDRLSLIIDRLLTVAAQIEEGRAVRTELGDAISAAVDRWRDRARQVATTFSVDGDTGAVEADGHDVDQILDVLLDNAITYAPGLVEIGTSANGSGVVLRVRDHGPGIPAEEIPRVTERFYRGRGAPTGGSGLGLAIARELAERWGGSLEVAVAPDGGTRVDVQLRRADRSTT
jgi:two-component system, OmpR family, sensor kinase